jgi:hypothetical protein
LEALCRVTLLQPFRGDPAAIVPLRDGQLSLVPMGAGGMSISDPAMHVGFNEKQTGNPDANRFNAAQDVTYELGIGDEGSIIVPVYCAQFHFGDWSITPGGRSQARTKRAYAQERIRVAMAWGDYTRMPRGRKASTPTGVEPDTRCIGLPGVPHVKIQILEQNGKPYGEAFVPWDHFKWETDIDAAAVREAAMAARELGMYAPPTPSLGFDLTNLSDDMLDKLAAIIAAKNGGQSGKSKPQTGA